MHWPLPIVLRGAGTAFHCVMLISIRISCTWNQETSSQNCRRSCRTTREECWVSIPCPLPCLCLKNNLVRAPPRPEVQVCWYSSPGTLRRIFRMGQRELSKTGGGTGGCRTQGRWVGTTISTALYRIASHPSAGRLNAESAHDLLDTEFHHFIDLIDSIAMHSVCCLQTGCTGNLAKGFFGSWWQQV